MTETRRVLVVEDNDVLRHALRSALEAQGDTVEEADDGLEGVQKAVAWRPDVAVIDMEVLVVDGYGLARRVRETLGAGVRLIALSASDDPERAQAGGFDVHLLKPVEPEQVGRLVHADC